MCLFSFRNLFCDFVNIVYSKLLPPISKLLQLLPNFVAFVFFVQSEAFLTCAITKTSAHLSMQVNVLTLK